MLETVFTLLSSGKEIRGACWLKFKVGNEGVPSHRPYEPLIPISIIQRLDFCLARSYYRFKTKYRNIEYKIPLTSLHYMKITITQKSVYCKYSPSIMFSSISNMVFINFPNYLNQNISFFTGMCKSPW